MKKFLLFVASMVIVVSSLLLVINAADPNFGTLKGEEYKNIIPQCHIFGDELNFTAEHKDGWFNEECARVLLKYTVNGTTKTETYPTYYIIKNDSTLVWDFAPLEACLESTYGADITLSVESVIQIEIPFGITEIPRRCFVPDNYWYENGTADKPEPHAVASDFLTYVELPNSLLKIADYAFAHCTSLSRIDSQRLADHEGEEGDGPVQGNHNHQMLQHIGFRAFHDCPISSFNFNKHLVHLGEAAFEGCHFTKIDLSKCVELKVIPAYCFHENANYHIETIMLSSSIEELGDYAFTGSSAGHVFLGLSLKKVGHGALTMSGSPEFVIIPPTLTEIYDDSFDFGNKSYSPIIVSADSANDVKELFNVLKSAGYTDLKQMNNPSKVYSDSVKFFADTKNPFCLTYLGGHTADPNSDIKSVEYPYGIMHEGTAYGGICAICDQATESVTVRPIMIAKGYSIRLYGELAAFSNGYEVYHNSLAVYESVYGECEIGLLFALASKYNGASANGGFDFRNNISSIGAILDENQLNMGEDASMDFIMTYSKGLVTPEGANRGAEPVVIAAYLLHKDAEKAGDKYNTSLYVQDTDELCIHKTYNSNGDVVQNGMTADGKYCMVSYNSISGIAHQELISED